jgi:hypothetical protein
VTTFSDDRLREEFASARNVADDGTACPEASKIWESAAQVLTAGENEFLLRHTATCGACAASWRLARALLDEEHARELPRGTRIGSRPWWLGLAAAAMLVLAVSFVALQQFRPTGPAPTPYRQAPSGTLSAEIDPATSLPREAFVLRWSGAPEVATYDLRVTTDRLESLHRAFGLERPECQVPESALGDLEPGAVILWSVTAHMPDGRRWTSPSFRAVVD